MFAAFSKEGEPLLIMPDGNATPAGSLDEHGSFGPGDLYLVRIHGTAKDHVIPPSANRLPIINPGNWYLCETIEPCQPSNSRPNATPSKRGLPAGSRLLVPHYQVGRPIDSESSGYRVVRFSPSIHVLDIQNGAMTQPTIKSSATAVLPDHFAAGHWTHLKESFPWGTEFILATDGFYSAFKDPAEMWAWLKESEHALHDEVLRPERLETLHERLRRSAGDDDISFIWVYPRFAVHEE
ncbi:MAG: hypothetical protein HY287_15085 [Planctomycetes bacterium]|nr:hypothetical protein [Planctomycetota bacterium]